MLLRDIDAVNPSSNFILKSFPSFYFSKICWQRFPASFSTSLYMAFFVHYFIQKIACDISVIFIIFSFSQQTYTCICRLPYVKQEAQQHKILYIGLYLLIWGEAANLRFMPECLCYIFHHVSIKCVSADYFLYNPHTGLWPYWWNTWFFHFNSHGVSFWTSKII